MCCVFGVIRQYLHSIFTRSTTPQSHVMLQYGPPDRPLNRKMMRSLADDEPSPLAPLTHNIHIYIFNFIVIIIFRLCCDIFFSLFSLLAVFLFCSLIVLFSQCVWINSSIATCEWWCEQKQYIRIYPVSVGGSMPRFYMRISAGILKGLWKRQFSVPSVPPKHLFCN